MGSPRILTRARIATACTVLALAGAVGARAELTALEVLDKSIASYASMEALAGRVDFTVVRPNGRADTKQLAYGRRGEAAFMALLLPNGTQGLGIVAAGGRLYASQFNVPNAYVDAPYDGDLPAALERVGGPQVGVALPAPLAAALTGNRDQFLEALGFGILGPVEVGRFETVEEVGEARYEIDLVAPNGVCTAYFDPASYALTGFRMVVGEGDHQLTGNGAYVETPLSELDAQLEFDSRSRQAVSDFAALEGSAYPLGEPAPSLDVRTLEGGNVSLADLRGSVVVLDFWATWCVPCWSTLEEVNKLAAWATSSGRPVAVYAVNTLEEFADPAQRETAVRRFLDDRGLSLPVLVDGDNSFFRAMHTPGLPSTVIVAPDGTLARYHSGVLTDMAEALRREVEELLGGSR